VKQGKSERGEESAEVVSADLPNGKCENVNGIVFLQGQQKPSTKLSTDKL
jgi:hypothetical protein